MAKVPQATQFDPAQIQRLAEALRAEILQQNDMLNACASAELFDEAMGMCDHVSDLIAFIEKDAEDFSARHDRYGNPTEYRAGGWGEV